MNVPNTLGLKLVFIPLTAANICFSGTLQAAYKLVKRQQAEVLACLVVIELKDLNGADKLKPTTVFSLVQYWEQLF